MVSERTRDALRYKIRNGEYIGAPPLGFEAVDKRLRAKQGELDLVKRIQQLRGRGRRRLSLQAVANQLNEEGYRSKRGGRFYASTVSYILKNQRYRGHQ